MTSARKINYIITQVIPIILFAIFHRYTDNATTKTTCFVMIFRHGKTMRLKTSRLITHFIFFFRATNHARQHEKGAGRDRTDELHIISYHKSLAIVPREAY